MLREILQLADGIDADAVAGRAGTRRRDRAAPGTEPELDRTGAGAAGERRLLMAGGRTSRGAWTWMAPDAEAADRALPGPWSLTLLLRGRPAGGSPP